MSTTAETSANEVATPAAAKVGVMSILIPVLLSTVITLAVVGGGAFWLVRSGKLGGGAAAAATATVVKVVEAEPASHVLALDPMIVNLADAGGRSYLRTALSLRIKDEPKSEKTDEKKDPKAPDATAMALRDTTLTVLSKETADSLLATEGKENLKKALEREYKLHNSEAPVIEVYFTDFLVQRG